MPVATKNKHAQRVIYLSNKTTLIAKNSPIQNSVERGSTPALLAQQSMFLIHLATLPMGFAHTEQMCQWPSLLAFSFNAFSGLQWLTSLHVLFKAREKRCVIMYKLVEGDNEKHMNSEYSLCATLSLCTNMNDKCVTKATQDWRTCW